MKQWLIAWAIGQLIARLTVDEDAIVKYLNGKIDIPKIGEETEAKWIRSLLRALKSFVQGKQ